MKILYVVTGLSVGGAENIVVNLANKFNMQGHTVKIVYLTGPFLIKPDRSVDTESLNMISGFSFFKALFHLKNIIHNFQPDVVHSHMYHANILSRVCRLLSFFSFKLVSSAHNSNEGGRIRMLSYRLTNFISDTFTNVSHEAVQSFEKKGAVHKGGMVTIMNGIDTEKFIRMSKFNHNSNFKIIAIGRLEAQKDYSNLLLAIKYVKDSGYDFTIDIVGDGVLKKELKELSQSYGLTEYVNWLGIRNDIPILLNRSDLFVLSSESEGFGLVVAEAMSCEIPVVATDCGGVREVIGNDSLLCPIKDSKQLANKIIELMKLTNSERALLGKKLRQRIITYYSIDRMCNEYFKYY